MGIRQDAVMLWGATMKAKDESGGERLLIVVLIFLLVCVIFRFVHR